MRQSITNIVLDIFRTRSPLDDRGCGTANVTQSIERAMVACVAMNCSSTLFLVSILPKNTKPNAFLKVNALFEQFDFQKRYQTRESLRNMKLLQTHGLANSCFSARFPPKKDLRVRERHRRERRNFDILKQLFSRKNTSKAALNPSKSPYWVSIPLELAFCLMIVVVAPQM